MNTKIFTWKIGGAAGDGQQAAGAIFAKACSRMGYYSYTSSDFPSAIRGGHVSCAVSIATHPISALYHTVNMLIALNDETVLVHADEMSKDGVLLYDEIKVTKETLVRIGKKIPNKHPLPLANIIKENNLKPISANMIAVGASCGLLHYDIKSLNGLVDQIFGQKSEEIRTMNRKAAEIGFYYAQKNFHPKNYHYTLKENGGKKEKVILNANNAITLGAVASGCRLYVAYPMSPSTSILHNMADWAHKTGIVVYQPEDEIAGVHVMLGAMYSGTRCMVATSGGGFALMAEAVALSAMTETPSVIAVSSRPGPATGLPTWTEQGDLKFIVNCGHGDFLRIVLVPSDPQDAYQFSALAFNLAEKYQLPVFILLDKYLSEGHVSYDDFNIASTVDRGKILKEQELLKMKEYFRYCLAKDGISARSLPGTKGGVHLANSDEHDEYGFSIEGWNSQMRKDQVDKRARKLPRILKDIPRPKLYGPKIAKVTILGWGSTKGPVLEALKSLDKVNYLHVPCVWPLDRKAITQALLGVKKLVIMENNNSGQFARILVSETGIVPDEKILKYSGEQFWPEEIIAKLRKT